MSAIACQITGVSIVCSNVCSGADQWKHQSSASLTFVSGIHRWPVGSTHKGPVTRITFPFDDAIISHKRIKHSTDVRILWYKLCNQTDYPISIFFMISQSLNVVKSMFRIPNLKTMRALWYSISEVWHLSRFYDTTAYHKIKQAPIPDVISMDFNLATWQSETLMFIFQCHMAVTFIGFKSLQPIWKYNENIPFITIIWNGNLSVLLYTVNNIRCRIMENLEKRKGKSRYQQKQNKSFLFNKLSFWINNRIITMMLTK